MENFTSNRMTIRTSKNLVLHEEILHNVVLFKSRLTIHKTLVEILLQFSNQTINFNSFNKTCFPTLTYRNSTIQHL